jgi:hypothetical protein
MTIVCVERIISFQRTRRFARPAPIGTSGQALPWWNPAPVPDAASIAPRQRRTGPRIAAELGVAGPGADRRRASPP